MFIESIRVAIDNVRNELSQLVNTRGIVYEAQPLVNITKHLIDLIERSGIPNIEAEEIESTNDATSKYFNDLSNSMHNAMVVVSRILDELTTNVNSSLTKYIDNVNTIEAAMKDLRQRIFDVEQQTLEKVTNASIYDHEIKNINFSKNIDVNTLTIVRVNTLTVINNSVILPVTSANRVVVNDIELAIRSPKEATNRLDGALDSTANKSDTETIIGTYFGNIVGMLDGSGVFTSEDDVDVTVLTNENINETVEANYYSNNIADELEVGMSAILNGPNSINFVSMHTNVMPLVVSTLGDKDTTLQLKNGIWIGNNETDTISFILNQKSPERLRFQGINIIDKDTSTIVKKHNYFTSMAHIFPTLLSRLNDAIGTTDIDITPRQTIQIAERSGFYKYHIETSGIQIFNNIYANTGYWESGLITTDWPIYSVELESEHMIPGDDIEYVRYEISFNRVTWHSIKAINEGVTPFNIDKKKRIVLNNDDDNPDYLFIGSQASDLGLYLRVSLFTNDTSQTPVIHNLQLKVKVDRT